MGNIAIKGHPTRGKEVIEVLEMLGGKNKFKLRGNEDEWFVLDNNLIQRTDRLFDEKGFTLEEFFEKFPYKVGDRVLLPEYESEVRIDRMIWDSYEILYSVFTDEVEWYTAAELNEFNDVFITMEDINREFYKEEIKCKVDDNSNHTDIKISSLSINDEDYADQIEINLGDNYEYKFEMNRLYIVKKKPQYPKTYEECCNILNIDCGFYLALSIDVEEIFIHFIKLKRCRDAYWKIAGEEMGLDKPWEPDWKDCTKPKYTIHLHCDGHIFWQDVSHTEYRWLSFPTTEIRDTFYENFKNLIEDCKELL